jgi:putative acetyltransferase
MVVLVRRFRPTDAPGLVGLFRETVRQVNGRDYSEEQVKAWAPDDIDVARWCEVVASRYTLVAEDEGALAGFGELEPDGHIDRFYVHAARQRRGIGRAIMQGLLDEARRRGIPRLRVESATTGRAFFESQGFRVLGEQVVNCRGVEMKNLRMERDISAPSHAPKTP